MITDIPAQAWVAVPGAAVVLGCIVVLKKYVFTNGKCPAEPVLQQHRENLIKYGTVNEGLTEAVTRNTAAIERQTNVLVMHNEHLSESHVALVKLAEVLGACKRKKEED